jgi:hypothetical protein
MPAVLKLAPGEPCRLRGRMEHAPVSQRLAMSGTPFDCWSGVGAIRC